MQDRDFVEWIVSIDNVDEYFKKLEEIKPPVGFQSSVNQDVKTFTIAVFHDHIEVFL